MTFLLEELERADECSAIAKEVRRLRAHAAEQAATIAEQGKELERLRGFVAAVRAAQSSFGFPPCRAGIAVVDALSGLEAKTKDGTP